MDEEYVKKRNKLIPKAEKYANEMFGSLAPENKFKWYLDWTRCFLDKMNELSIENGLLGEVSKKKHEFYKTWNLLWRRNGE